MDIQKRIEKLEEELESLKQGLKCKEMPNLSDKYYYIEESLSLVKEIEWTNDIYDINHFSFGNCYLLKSEAEEALQNKKTKVKLQQIANRFNKVDWGRCGENKYCLYLDCIDGEIEQDSTDYYKDAGVVHCSSDKFKDIAMQEIGEEELMRYFKSDLH